MSKSAPEEREPQPQRPNNKEDIRPATASYKEGATMNSHPGLAEMEAIIADMPTSLKTSYDKAAKHFLRLVATESEPIKFLRCAKMSAEAAAAERLKAHWSHRCELFGDRAFYPMGTIGARGAHSRRSRGSTDGFH
jgi:hypothetical protein